MLIFGGTRFKLRPLLEGPARSSGRLSLRVNLGSQDCLQQLDHPRLEKTAGRAESHDDQVSAWNDSELIGL